MNSKELTTLIKRKPYEITSRNAFKCAISLENVELCTVPANLAEAIVGLLNGAYIIGVSKSFSLLDDGK